MASGTFFVRSCPTCGRKLEIRVELLGREVECVHCRASFTADTQEAKQIDDQKIEQVLAKAQEYIDSVAPIDSAPAEGF